MWKANYAKFTQDPKLKALLLSTGDRELIKDTPHDYIWGCGKDETGQNLFGKVLMEVRAQIRKDVKEVN